MDADLPAIRERMDTGAIVGKSWVAPILSKLQEVLLCEENVLAVASPV
jgi:hypothetical protein